MTVGSLSCSNDDIVECDCCGISVHEGEQCTAE